VAGGPDDWQARAAQLCGAEFLDGFLISHRPVNLHCNPGNARVKMGSPGRFEAWGIGIQSGVYDEEKRRHFSRGGERFLSAVSHEFLKTPTWANVFRLVSTFAF